MFKTCLEHWQQRTGQLGMWFAREKPGLADGSDAWDGSQDWSRANEEMRALIAEMGGEGHELVLGGKGWGDQQGRKKSKDLSMSIPVKQNNMCKGPEGGSHCDSSKGRLVRARKAGPWGPWSVSWEALGGFQERVRLLCVENELWKSGRVS